MRRFLLSFRYVAKSRFPLSGNLLRHCPRLLAVGTNCRIYRSLGQLARFPQMTSVCLGVGCERKPNVLFRSAPKPLLLFCYGRRIPAKKIQSIEGIVKHEIVLVSRLHLLDGLARFVKPLRSKQAIEDVTVCVDIVRVEPQVLAIRLCRFLKEPLIFVHTTEKQIWSARVVLDCLLSGLCRLVQFPRYIEVVVSTDCELFALAGVVS